MTMQPEKSTSIQPQPGSQWWHPDRRGSRYEVIAADMSVIVVDNGLKDDREVIWIDREIWPGEWRHVLDAYEEPCSYMNRGQSEAADPMLAAIDEADRFVRRAMANVARLPENALRRTIEENLMRALDVLQAELEEVPDA